MTENKELNEQVAQKLGWTYWQNQDAPGLITGKSWWRDKSFGEHETVPDYCGSIQATWEILDKQSSWFLGKHYQGPFVCRLIDDETYQAEADTAPLAIVKAFLKLP